MDRKALLAELRRVCVYGTQPDRDTPQIRALIEHLEALERVRPPAETLDELLGSVPAHHPRHSLVEERLIGALVGVAAAYRARDGISWPVAAAKAAEHWPRRRKQYNRDELARRIQRWRRKAAEWPNVGGSLAAVKIETAECGPQYALEQALKCLSVHMKRCPQVPGYRR